MPEVIRQSGRVSGSASLSFLTTMVFMTKSDIPMVQRKYTMASATMVPLRLPRSRAKDLRSLSASLRMDTA